MFPKEVRSQFQKWHQECEDRLWLATHMKRDIARGEERDALVAGKAKLQVSGPLPGNHWHCFAAGQRGYYCDKTEVPETTRVSEWGAALDRAFRNDSRQWVRQAIEALQQQTASRPSER